MARPRPCSEFLEPTTPSFTQSYYPLLVKQKQRLLPSTRTLLCSWWGWQSPREWGCLPSSNGTSGLLPLSCPLSSSPFPSGGNHSPWNELFMVVFSPSSSWCGWLLEASSIEKCPFACEVEGAFLEYFLCAKHFAGHLGNHTDTRTNVCTTCSRRNPCGHTCLFIFLQRAWSIHFLWTFIFGGSNNTCVHEVSI